MADAGFDLRFDISGPSDDGTFLALCRDFPMVIAGTTEEELRERMVKAVNQLVGKLRNMQEAERATFLRDAGVTLNRSSEDERSRTASLPVTVSVTTR